MIHPNRRSDTAGHAALIPVGVSKLTLLLLCICLPLWGCSVIRQDVGQPLVVDTQALADSPDYHHVLRMLGPPHQLSRTAQGMTFLYEEVDLLERQLGLNLTMDDVTLFKAVVAREFSATNGRGVHHKRLSGTISDSKWVLKRRHQLVCGSCSKRVSRPFSMVTHSSLSSSSSTRR